MGRKLKYLFIFVGVLLILNLTYGQQAINGSRYILGYWDASQARWTKPFYTSDTQPATCAVGEVMFDTNATAGQNIYLCTATDTWTQVTGGGGTGTPGGAVGNVQYNDGAGGFAAEAALTYDAATNILTSGKVTISDTCTLGAVTTLAAGTLCFNATNGMLTSDGSNWYTVNFSQDNAGAIWYSGANYEPTTIGASFSFAANILNVPTVKLGTAIRGNSSNLINLDPDSDGTIEVNFDASGNFSGLAGSATALAANGANCSAGQAPLGVDASGAVESCWTPSTGPTTDDAVLVGDGTTNAEKTIPDCKADNQTLSYDATNNAWGCGDDDTAAGGGDEVSVDSTATTNPDFQDGGDIDFTYNTGVVTAAVKAESVQQGDLDWDTTTARTENQCVQIGASANTLKAGSCGAGAQDIWTTIDVDGTGDMTPDSTGDTLTITAGTGITITGTAASDTITITNSSPASGISQVDIDGDGTLEISLGSSTLSFDPDEDGTAESTISSTGAYSGSAAQLATDPTGCTNMFVTDMAAAGALTCNSVTGAYVTDDSLSQADLDWDTTAARTESQCVQIGASASTFKAGSCGGGAQNLWLTIDTSSGTDITADNTQDTMVLSGGTGISVTGDGTNTVTIASTVTDTDDQNLWATIDTPTGTDVTADNSSDTLILAAGTGVSISGDGTNTVTITNTAPDTNQNIWSTVNTSSGTDVTPDGTATTLNLSGGTGITITGDGTATVTIASTVVDTDTDDQPLWLTINTSSGTDVTADDSADTLNLTGGTGITITGDGTATVTIASTVTDTGDELTVDDTATATPDLTDDASSDIDFSYNATSKDITAVVKANSVALGTDTTGNYAGSSAEAGVATSALALDSDGDGTIEVQTASTAFTVDPDENGTAELTIDATGNSFSWDINNDGTTEFSYDADGTPAYFCMDPDDNGNCDFMFVDEGSDATPQVGIRFHGAAKPTILHDENAKTFIIDNDEDGTYEFNLDGSAVQILLDPNSDGTTDMLLNQAFLQTDQVRYSTESAARMTAANGRMHMCGGNQFAPNAAAGACLSLGGSSGTYANVIHFDPDGDGTIESTIDGTGNFSGTAAVATMANEIEDGTGVAADSAGEIKLDTTANQLVYYGTAARVYDPRQTLSAVLMAPTDADTPIIFKAPFGMTITDIDCIVGAATSAVIDVQECTNAGASCATVDATITCDTDGAADDGSLTNGAIDAGDWIKLDIGTVTGTVGYVSVTIIYTITQE